MQPKLDRLKLSYILGATFDYQQKIIACMDKFRTVKKPRQAGMTTAFAIEALIDAVLQDDYVVCIVSPTQRQSARMMRYIKKGLRILERELGSIVPTARFTSNEVFFHHDSEIYSLPNNPLGIQGIDCNHGIVDEAGLFGVNEGEAIIDALIGSLAAKQGRLTISGKPHGKRGLLWKYWNSSEECYNEFTHFSITWEDRARQDPSYGREVGRHKKILAPLQFDETYGAVFIDEGVLIFPYTLLEKAIALWYSKRFVLMPPEGTPSTPNSKYIGMDFGRKRSLTEIHVLERVEEHLLRTLMMKSLKETNFEDQKIYIDNLIGRVKPYKVTIDERGMGLPLLDYLQRKYGENLIQPLKLTEGKGKEKVILQCQNVFTDLQIAIPEEAELLEQLHSFQKEYTDAGNVRYFGKVSETDFMDDKVIALVAAVDAAQAKPFKFGVF